ncbi:ABC transporter ATP-binding protein [Fusobacterium sp. PH5-44]|uniref:ABC transporter ATP-binding protein n=1 Tax=unclassified Fusobacterium TaxID=2648384 RepID=UPI003D1EC42B
MNSIIMKLENIGKYYEGDVDKLHILRDLNLTIEKGEFISILGRSGSGKSTLLNIMGLLDKVDKGNIYIENNKLETFKEKELNAIKNKFLGFIFQFHYLLPEFTALENVMIPAMINKDKNMKEIEKRAKKILEAVELQDRMSHKPSQLSGGEKQRVAIARAMINSPKLILADEPTGNLDEETSENIFKIFKNINEAFAQTIVVVTHSRDLAKITQRSYYLKKGILMEEVN